MTIELLERERRGEVKLYYHFLGWLLDQTERDDPVGDIARDVEQDGTRVKPADRLRRHVERTGACEDALRAFDEAVDEWEQLPSWDVPGGRYTVA